MLNIGYDRGHNAIWTPQARRVAGKSTPTVTASRVGTTHFAGQMDKNPNNRAWLVIGLLPKYQKFFELILEEEPVQTPPRSPLIAMPIVSPETLKGRMAAVS